MILTGPVLAIALFARQYGVTCTKCHTVIPHLTTFGAHFLAAGDRIPGLSAPPGAAAKLNLVASSERQGPGPNGAGLPKAILDEMELFVSGTLGTRASFFLEQYVLDGGLPGNLREAWASERLNPWDARIPLSAQIGSMTLLLPVDPETFRETYQHYAIFDQTIGASPFDLFAPEVGFKVTVGDTLRGTSAQVFAKPNAMMAAVSHTAGAFTPALYHYAGLGFSRTGYAFSIRSGKWQSDSLLQTGWNVGPPGVASSGGFTQVRYAFDSRTFALARYEGTNDGTAFARDAVFALGYAPARNARLTVEDVISHAPRTTHVGNVQLTIGF